jgi:superfamily II DNA or RNA helicase
MGSGKTLTSINIAVQELKRESVEGVIVLTPKSLYQNFIKELNKVVHMKSDLRKKFHISSYMQFLGKRLKYSALKNIMIIVDEAHNFRGIGSTSEKLLNVCANSKKVLLLSATPI